MVGLVGRSEVAGVEGASALDCEGMVIRVWHDGQLIPRPIHWVATRMCWPQVGQLNLNSVLGGMASVFMPPIYPEASALDHWLTPGAVLSETLRLPMSAGAKCGNYAFTPSTISTGIHMCFLKAFRVLKPARSSASRT